MSALMGSCGSCEGSKTLANIDKNLSTVSIAIFRCVHRELYGTLPLILQILRASEALDVGILWKMF